MTPALIELSNLGFTWPGHAQLLDIPTFRLEPGETLFLKGPSGSGKTTLLGGVQIPNRGSIRLLGQELVPPDAPKIAPITALIHDLSKLSDALSVESAPAAHQQSPYAPVVKALNGQRVRLPGYIVPLEVSEEGRVTEFLLVPYFGACIHVPPPPLNQIVHVTSELGVKVDELYQPYWIEGPMQVKASISELADAGYQMEADKILVYELPDS